MLLMICCAGHVGKLIVWFGILISVVLHSCLCPSKLEPGPLLIEWDLWLRKQTRLTRIKVKGNYVVLLLVVE